MIMACTTTHMLVTVGAALDELLIAVVDVIALKASPSAAGAPAQQSRAVSG